MKTLKTNQLESIIGGTNKDNCQFNMALGLGLLAIGIVSGGAGFVFAGALFAFATSERDMCDGVTSLWE
jgi:hypothetical protein